MERIVLKFGGTSLADAEKIWNAAKRLARAAETKQVIGVLSAQGHTTDALLQKARELRPDYPPRELDALLATGEQISVSLCAAALDALGCKAISLTGCQAGLLTDSRHTEATMLQLQNDRIERELAQGKLVLVAGFQGVDARGDITTLGRGGSDTTAVALAAMLGAAVCEIYTDVDGVYTADPRLHPEATLYAQLSYERMLALIADGAQVLHEKSVLLARQAGMPIRVCSAFRDVPGTWVTQAPSEAATVCSTEAAPSCSDRSPANANAPS